jgi:hypothetical protein
MEFGEQRSHLRLPDVGAQQDIELQGLELDCNVGRIVDRVGQARDVPVG